MSELQGEEPRRHVVVFDCNIYLDIAEILGAPFAWEKFQEQVAVLSRASNLRPIGQAYDSLRAVAVSTSGVFAGLETLEVWTNTHIDRTVRHKASQSKLPDPQTGYRGLGWSAEDAQTLVVDLIGGIIEQSSGGTLGTSNFPDGHPPLDHEDGMVFGACRKLAGEDPFADVYCVTRDDGFLTAYRDGRLGQHSRVITPTKFVQLIRGARNMVSIHQMRP